MPQSAQTRLSETDFSTNEFPVSSMAISGKQLSAQKEVSAANAVRESSGKRADVARLKESDNSHLQNTERAEHILELVASLKSNNAALCKEIGGVQFDQAVDEETHLLQLIASLESCNIALLIKLNQAQLVLSALRQSPATISPDTKLADHREQSFGWERKLTRSQWRPI